ncbi:maturation of Asn-linked oligosaccharides protein [Steccherinum ochraceum]|uniref:alpha-1,2-Mannosidase n=1 Tax=Steccherinum ochraceum TaxID=92696 RepID=A0A4R0REL2_9APHY|nr:maturation of Asn-linked oligosaccharides protein [Steccherinum ochraceum]
MQFRQLVLLACVGAGSVFAGPIQNRHLVLPKDAATHKQAVEKIFLDSYAAYKQFAFGHDDLEPVSETFTDGRNGWGASIVDAMTTMSIMGQNDLFEEAVNFASKIDFSISHTTDTTSVFETSIRYLGGLLSAFELSGQKHPILVQKATQVADKMSQAWSLGNVIPYGFVDFNTSQPTIDTSNIAEAGTLTLEWSTLSKHTGNDTYRKLAENSVRHIAGLTPPLPGLAAQGIDPTSGNFVGAYVSWGGGSDSYFEYLIKYPRLSNINDNIFADTWATAVDTSMRVLARTSTVGNHLYLADQQDDGTIRHIGSHLACFHAGNWLMGGKMMNNQTIVDFALKLADACWNTYESTLTGIGMEAFGFFSSDGNFTGATPTSDDLAFYAQHGFFLYPGSEYYLMRPEVLESNFYAWRVTGDTKYLDRAASAVNSFNKWLKAPAGFAGIWNVNEANSGFIDDMESFWFAEVLKYLYLTFDDPNHISLDEWVFNTEAHPFKAPPAKATYGSGIIGGGSSFAPFKSESGELPEISFAPVLRKQIKDQLGL